MYNLLNLYNLKYNKDEPQICIDEKSKQLLGDIKKPITTSKGSKLQDYEYKRNGTKNLFVAIEPKAGYRNIKVTNRRNKTDFAHYIKELINLPRYKNKKKIHLILDNLNTHFKKSFYDTFNKKEAEEVLSRIEFHYTPKHASWLNQAEIEIGSIEKICFGKRRIPSTEKLITELKAFEKDRNHRKVKINWQFTKEKADEKMGKYYVPT